MLPLRKKQKEKKKKRVRMSFMPWTALWVTPGEVKSHELIDFCLQKKNVNALFKVLVPTRSVSVILPFESAVVSYSIR